MTEKEKIRAEFLGGAGQAVLPAGLWGKTAEMVRRLESYRQSATVFVTPAAHLTQIRINALLDGKNLLMPSPGLKDGFFILPPLAVPFQSLGFAVTHRGLPKFGQRLPAEAAAEYPPGIILTGAVAVDRQGGRLGDGRGLVDLSCALLAELGPGLGDPPLYAVIAAEQLITTILPRDPWDVPLTGAITPVEIVHFPAAPTPAARIFWDKLTLKQIKKISPLWQLYNHRNPLK